VEALVSRCEHCNEAVAENKRGRPQRFCSDKCRQAHRKIASTAENVLRYRPGQAKPKSISQVFDVEGEFKPENLSPETSAALKCKKVNEVTFKITNGDVNNVPASHGQWGGYRTTKAVAWILKLGPDAWIARCGDHICNPTSFNKAKSQALAIARGAVGDYFVADPIRELNELQARLLNADEDAQGD
jgi:hypothetical protein